VKPKACHYGEHKKREGEEEEKGADIAKRYESKASHRIVESV